MSINILNSQNDWKLINELVSLVEKYNKNQKTIDKKFVKKAVKILENNYQSSFIEVLSQESENSKENPIGYMQYDNLNYEDCILYFNFDIWNKINFYVQMYYTLKVIIHEFTHKICFKLINNYEENNDNLIKLMIYLFDFCNETGVNHIELNKIYKENHNLFITERIANIKATYITWEIFNKLLKNHQITNIQKHCKDTFFEFLLENYDEYGTYPLKTFTSIIEEEITKNPKLIKNLRIKFQIPNLEIRDDNLLERLYLGLEITKNEYKYLKRLSEEEKDIKNIKRKIKMP